MRKIRRTFRHIMTMGLCSFIRTYPKRANNFKTSKHPEVVLINLPKFSLRQPPLGLAYLKAYLENQNISVRCFDLNVSLYNKIRNKRIFSSSDATFISKEKFETFRSAMYNRYIDKWTRDIIKLEPKIIGISATSHMTYLSIKTFVGKLRKQTRAKIIIGGPAADESLLPFADYIVKGAGEKALLYLLKNNPKNRIITGRDIFPKLPFPDFSDFNLDYYELNGFFSYPTIPIVSSRSCTFNCKFCNTKHYWDHFCQRTPESVFKEMVFQKERYGTPIFEFNDSMINTDKNFVWDLCNLIIKHKEIFHWSANIRIISGVSYELYKIMVKAGCNTLNIGVETASEKLRREMGKEFSNKELLRQLRFMNKAGIDVKAQFMIGYPTETHKDFITTLNFIKKYRSLFENVRFGVTYRVTKGSFLEKNSKVFGIGCKDGFSWSYKDNTPEQRQKKIRFANRFGMNLGLVKHEDANDAFIKRPPIMI